MTIRTARLDEHPAIEALQYRSSVHSGTYAAQLAEARHVVVTPAAQIEHGLVRVVESDGALAGFSVLLEPADGACELDGLFVEPAHMGTGLGRLLVEDAANRARTQGARRIDVVANPDALGFYGRLGFVDDGEELTLLGPGRRMHLDL